MADIRQPHALAGGEIRKTTHGTVATCVCGWSSGHRSSPLAAVEAYGDHLQDMLRATPSEGGRGG